MKILLLVSCVLAFVGPAFSQTKKVLFVLTSHDTIPASTLKTGFWLSELTHPYYEVLKAGLEADIVSIKGGVAPIEQRSTKNEDPDNKKFLSERSSLIQNTKPLREISAIDYGAVFFVGGHGGMWDFAHSSDIDRLSREIYEAGGIVASVCHGPAALVNIKLSSGKYLVAGKRVAAFTNEEEKAVNMVRKVPFLLEDELKARGAIFSKAALFQKHVQVDQRLITGQNPASAREVGFEMAKLLKQRSTP